MELTAERAATETMGERMTKAFRVSVVVPTRGRPELLDRCLHALDHQSLDASEYEVVVVDDDPGSTAAKAVALHAAVSPVPYRYVQGEGRGPAAARNAGWRAARANIVAFTDDDCVPDEKWLEAGLGEMDELTAGLSGAVVVPLPEDPTDYERDAARLAGSHFVTANVFYRVLALKDVGGFDERFTAAWREDADLYFTLLERGFPLKESRKARVLHPVRPAEWGVSLRQQSKTQFNALLHKKHPALYETEIGRSPRWYYLSAGSAVVTLLALGIRRRRVAALSGAVWAATTVGFASRRLRDTARSPQHVTEMLVTSAFIPLLSVFHRIRGMMRFGARYW